MCDITTIDKENRGKVTVEFERRADFRATEVFVINQGPRDDLIEVGVSIMCTDSGKFLNIEQLPMREPRGLIPEPPADRVSLKEIRGAWEALKKMSFFKNSVGKCSEVCRLKSGGCEIVKLDGLLEEE